MFSIYWFENKSSNGAAVNNCRGKASDKKVHQWALGITARKILQPGCDSREIVNKTTNEQFIRYLNDYEMTVGRRLGMVYSETRWGNSLREDAARPGFVDTLYLASKNNPNDEGLDKIKPFFGSNQDVVTHDRSNAFPDWMDKYTLDDGQTYFPTNNDAAAELIAHLMKHRDTDFQRTKYYELVNEPHWQFWSNQDFIDLHTKTKQKFDEMSIPTEVGGPCYSVGYFYRDKFKMNSITDFIDRTNFKLDFYSFHIYDYMRWDDSKNDFVGTVSSGLPEEAVFDALAAYTHNRYGRSFNFVGSEHGGYVGDGSLEQAENKMASQYFPGSGFEHEMEKRSLSNFIMVNSAITNTMMFMNHPHVVKKAVPFILLESAGWDTRYYSSLLVKENFDKNAPNYVESKLIYFYDFFKDVKGYRVESSCNDNDIQQHAFIDGKKLILLFHNQSNQEGSINIDLDSGEEEIEKKVIKRIGRKIDFRPYLTEEDLETLNNIPIKGQESIVVTIYYNEDVEFEKKIDYVPYYSTQTAVKFADNHEFSVKIAGSDEVVAAELRIGIARDQGDSKQMNVFVNGNAINIPVEDCAERITTDKGYGSMRSIKIDPSILVANNKIVVQFPDGKEGAIGAVVIRAAKNRTDAVEGVNVQESIELFQGQKVKLSYDVLPLNADDKSVSWKSLDENIAVVEDGKVTGKNIGNTAVVIKTNDGDFTDTCWVRVEQFEYVSTVQKKNLKAIYADDDGFAKGMLKEFAVDGDKDTYWHTEWIPNHTPLPHEIWIDLGAEAPIDRFVMTPRQDDWGPNGTIGDYELFISNDTTNWGQPFQVGSFVWDSVGNGQYYYKEEKKVDFSEQKGQYFRLLALSEHQNKLSITTTCVAEMDFSVKPKGIEIAKAKTILRGSAMTIDTVRILPHRSFYVSDLFNWFSIDDEIATVEGGLITGIKEGETQIVVETFDGLWRDTCTVSVIIPKYNIDFKVVDRAGIPMDAALVQFNSSPYQCNAYGETSISSVQEGEYAYRIEKSGRSSFAGTLELKSDTVLNITLEYLTKSTFKNDQTVKLFPNPVTNVLNIELEQAAQLQLYLLDGRKLLSQQLPKGHSTLDVQLLKQGRYIAYVKNRTSTFSRLISIAR